MKKVLCSIRDVKAEAWSPPLTFASRAQAVRAFGDVVNDASSEYGKHPEDYTVFAVALFDELTGAIEVLPQPESLAVGVNLIREV